jgi:maltokinase
MHTHLSPQLLESFLVQCRWFAGKAREITTCSVPTALPFGESWLCVVEVVYAEGDNEYYQLPLAFRSTLPDNLPEQGLVGTLPDGYLVDALYTEEFRQRLYQYLYEARVVEEAGSSLVFRKGKGFGSDNLPDGVRSRVLPADSSNSALIFEEKYFFKLYRKLFRETNPEVELVEFITEQSGFGQIPAFCGSMTWRTAGSSDVTLGMMQQMVTANKDNWAMTGDYLNDFLYGVPLRVFSIQEHVFEQVALLGTRTGEMHRALYAPGAAPAFAPEPFTTEYIKFLLKRISHLLDSRYSLLIDKYQELDLPTQHLAWKFMESRELIEDFTQVMLKRSLSSLRIRIHGDYHLGQVLSADHDFIIIDFEGEPEASITERKIKHSPLKDVAGMVRSYHYAVSAKIFHSTETQGIEPQRLLKVTDRWYKLIKDTFLDAYMETFGWPHPLFKDQSEINFLMLYYLLEKAVYELGYELSYRPDWVKIPLKGIVDVIREIEKLKGQ